MTHRPEFSLVLELDLSDLAYAARLLQGACEGHVRMLAEQASSFPQGQFPCCIGCGEFKTRNHPLSPGQVTALEDILREHGYVPAPEDEDAALLDLPEGESPYGKCPYACPDALMLHTEAGSGPGGSAIVALHDLHAMNAAGGGHCIELACYQAAMKRYRGDDPDASVFLVEAVPGKLRAAVYHSMQHEKPERRGTINDPMRLAEPEEPCDCGGGALVLC